MTNVTPIRRDFGRMLVTGVPEIDHEFVSQVLDLSQIDGASLLERRRQRLAKFATAPFDPDGHALKFYPGGITLWSGFPGAGKTTLLRQFVCHTLARGSSVFLASLEENPEDVLTDLAATASGGEPNAHQLQWFVDAYQERFRLWGVIGVAQHRQILGAIRTLAALGVRHAVIDSLMRLDIANDDNEAQRQFANLLSATAKISKVHVHLVAHPRKLMNADQDLDLNDIAGAKELGGVADNVIFIRRSKDRLAYSAGATAAPMCVSIRKQRYNRGILRDFEGWYQRDLLQFSVEQFPQGPARYLPEDAYL